MSFRARFPRLAFALLAPACAGELDTGALDEGEAPDDFKVAEKIVGGRLESGFPAVGALMTADGGLCTGTVIAPRWVLTAAHCLENGVSGAYFLLGNDVENPTRRIRVSSGKQHPQYDQYEITNDIALVKLASDAGVAPMQRVSSLQGQVGAQLNFVGFGITSGQGYDSGVKRSVTMALKNLEATTFSYGETRRNTCSGDSGGPAFLTVGGVPQVAGVTSYGDMSCRQYGVDTRVDVFRAWIDTLVGADAGTPSPQEPPPAQPPANDPCGGLTYQGECQGAVARWCENGKIKSNDCAREGKACGWVDDSTGFYCQAAGSPTPPPVVDDPCGGLSYQGECQGATARWCEDGAIRQRDCGSFGQGCGFVSDQVGFYCR